MVALGTVAVFVAVAGVFSATVSASAERTEPRLGFYSAKIDASGNLLPARPWRDALEIQLSFYANTDHTPVRDSYPEWVFNTFMESSGINGTFKSDGFTILPGSQDAMGIISFLKAWELSGRKDTRSLNLAAMLGDYVVRYCNTWDIGECHHSRGQQE
jgi:hypothetical protein